MNLLTKQEIAQLLADAMMPDPPSKARGIFHAAPNLARTALDALARLEDAEAAQALAVERAAKLVDKRAEEYDREFGIYDYTTGVTEYPGTGSESMEEWESISAAIRALADPSGVAALAALRARLNEAQGLIYAARLERNAAEDQEKELAEELRAVRAEAADLRARLAAAEGRVAALTEALDNLLDAITAEDRLGARSLVIQGSTAALKWLIEAQDDARAALRAHEPCALAEHDAAILRNDKARG